ncbi:MAG: ASCH domain-containing protein [Tepidisphaeraceae bacterium]
MPQLWFKKQFRQAILCGQKTATLRRWRKRRMTGGSRVHAPGIGWLILESVEPIEWDSLTRADARADGFASLKELAAAVRRIYPDMDDDGKSWFRLTFRLDSQDPRLRLAQVVSAELDKAVRCNGS